MTGSRMTPEPRSADTGMSERWNPFYLAYCRAHDMEPDVMQAHDRERWPGGSMCGFVVWIGQQWSGWDRLNGRTSRDPRDERVRAAFGAWLDARTSPAQLELLPAAA